MEQHKIFSKWHFIRCKRNELLKREVDPMLPYIAYGDLSKEEADKIRELRRRLLDLPSEIQAKIDSGEIESVLKYKFNEAEILGVPTPEKAESGEQ